jgi:hypothetical protein
MVVVWCYAVTGARCWSRPFRYLGLTEFSNCCAVALVPQKVIDLTTGSKERERAVLVILLK